MVDRLPRPARQPLDQLPIPDYDEFFVLAKQLGIRSTQPGVAIEASLGCWWGEKNLCTFCGLNATSLAFTQKSPERVLRAPARPCLGLFRRAAPAAAGSAHHR